MATTYDLMHEFEGRERGSTFLLPGHKSAIWWQDAGKTVITSQRRDSPNYTVQSGDIAYAATVHTGNGYSRMVTRRAFGPNIDVFGWFRVFHWDWDASDNHGVKLYTGYEDNNCNNTISLLRRGMPTSWYVEDRLGVYPQRKHHSGDNQVLGDIISDELHVRHRFFWKQRVEDGKLRGRLFIDGVEQFSFLSDDPLYRGHMGWRLDRTGTDWSVSVREY